MDRSALFIDAGYLFAHGSTAISGVKLTRGQTHLDEPKAIAFFVALAQRLTGLSLLRVYWYDGTSSGPTNVHRSLAHRDNVKVRLGIINFSGQQKGVDSLIVSDLIDLARHRAICDAVLLTGDEDIRVGVQKAQETGVRVHLVGIDDGKPNQSVLLQQEADTTLQIAKNEIQTFLTQVVTPPPTVTPLASAGSLQMTAQQFAGSLSKIDIDRVVNNPSRSIPSDLDRSLLIAGAAATPSNQLSIQDKRDLRKVFVAACKGLHTKP